MNLTGCGKSPPAWLVHLVYLVYLVYLVSLVSLVHLVYPVSLVQPNKQDKPNKPIKRDRPDRPDRPNEQDRLADFSHTLLGSLTPSFHFVSLKSRRVATDREDEKSPAYPWHPHPERSSDGQLNRLPRIAC